MARRLRWLRFERDLSLGALADDAGLHIMTIGALERGVLNASVDVLEHVAASLEVPRFALFTPEG